MRGFSRSCLILPLAIVIMVKEHRICTLHSIFHIYMICQRVSKRLVRGRVYLDLPMLKRKR